MTLIETHAHLDYPDFATDLPDVLQRAHDAGVRQIITIGTGLASSHAAISLAEKFPNVFAAVGIHPCHAAEELPSVTAITQLARHPRVVAIGEIGLDYFRLPGGPEAGGERQSASHPARLAAIQTQKAVFRPLLQAAATLGKPVILHQRASWDDTLEVLAEFTGRVRGVLHCFGGTETQARQALEMGHLVSFTGIATFKNGAAVRQTAAALAPGQFMVETDCPYLAPEPHRGKRCEPWHTRLVAEALAKARGETLQTLAAHTTATARAFFSLPEP